MRIVLGGNQNFRNSTSVEPIYQYICTKAMSKMWLLRQMNGLKLETSLIFDYYANEIRPLADQGVIVWNYELTKAWVSDRNDSWWKILFIACGL